MNNSWRLILNEEYMLISIKIMREYYNLKSILMNIMQILGRLSGMGMSRLWRMMLELGE